MKLSRCFVKSFRDLFNTDVVKTVLMISVPIFALYIGVLAFFWRDVLKISHVLISWVPFSVLKINGAFFILFFLWFLCVALSFAVLNALFGAFFFDKAKERNFYFYTVVSIVVFSVFYAFLFIKNWDLVNYALEKLLTLLPFSTVSEGVSAIVAVYVFYNIFILTLYILIFFFARAFLSAIKELEYPGLRIERRGSFKYKRISIFNFFKITSCSDTCSSFSNVGFPFSIITTLL